MNTKVWHEPRHVFGTFVATLSLALCVGAQQPSNPSQQQQPSNPAQTERQTTPTDKQSPATQTERRTSPDQTREQQPSTQTQQSTPAQTEQQQQTNPSQSGTATGQTSSTTAQTGTAGNIIETARKAGNFTTFLKAVEAAGITDQLTGTGPITVLAPTDEAFAKLPAGKLDELLKPENKEQLRSLLSRHIITGNVTAADVAKMDGKAIQQGSDLKVSTTSAEGVKVGNAIVKQTDIAATNGIIHAIDSVLMPGESSPSMKSTTKGSSQKDATKGTSTTDKPTP